MRRSLPRLFAQLWSIPLVLLFVSNSYSQVPPNQKHNRIPVRTVIPQENGSRDRIPVINYLEEDPQRRAQAQLALREDFRKLQVINLELLKLMARKQQPLDKDSQKKVKSSLGEIRKLAERLRTGFRIPEEERGEEEAGDLALVPGILLLDKAITSFVENPLFQQPRVFDSELAMKAARDVNEIARLTGVLRNLL